MLKFRWWGPAALAVMAAAWAICLGRSLWTDEFGTFMHLAGGFGDVFSLAWDVAHESPLYFLVLKAWTTVVGTGEIALRFPSFVALLAALPFLHSFARHFTDEEGAWFVTLVFAATPTVAFTAVNARPYAMGLFFSCMALWGHMAWVVQARRAGWVALVAGLAGGFYFHPFFATTGFISLLLYSITPAEAVRRGPGSYLAALAAAAALAAPWAGRMAEIWGNRRMSSFLPALEPGFIAHQFETHTGFWPIVGLAAVAIMRLVLRGRAMPWLAAPLVMGVTLAQPAVGVAMAVVLLLCCREDLAHRRWFRAVAGPLVGVAAAFLVERWLGGTAESQEPSRVHVAAYSASFLGILLAATVRAGAPSDRWPSRRLVAAGVLTGFGIPAVFVAISFLSDAKVIVPRYFLPASAGAALLIGLWMRSLNPMWLRLSALGVVVAPTVLLFLGRPAYQEARSEDWRSVWRSLAALSEHDALFFQGWYVESRDMEWLSDPTLSRHLTAPFVYYAPRCPVVALPYFIGYDDTAPHRERVARVASQRQRFFVMTPFADTRIWFDGRFGPAGYVSREWLGMGRFMIYQYERHPERAAKAAG